MKKDVCPICEALLTKEIMNNYDEPPESNTSCETCGFNEYYFYYEGCSTYMQMAVPKENDESVLELKGFLITGDEKNFISREEYKKMVDSYLKENKMTLDSITSALKEFREQKLKEKERLKLEEEAKQARWKSGDLLESEKVEINKFLSNQKNTIKNLGKVAKITKENINSDGLLLNLEFEINSSELDELVSSKVNAQRKYCVENKVPMFAPTNSCYRCGFRIFSLKRTSVNMFGRTFSKIEEPISLDKCSSGLITGCPTCNRSFVD